MRHVQEARGPDWTVLGIETSCDETAAAVVRQAAGGAAEALSPEILSPEILSNVVLSQIEAHRPYGGVVPEIAARAHLDHLDGLIRTALDEAGLGFADLTGVAATAGPGLIGGVMVGLMTGKAIAAACGLPFAAINHLEAHALSARLTGALPFPYLLLLVSGGHCQLLAVEGVGAYVRYGGTIDDAVGEAFDKVAKLLGLGYPGGPAVEARARDGDPRRFALPRPLKGRPDCDFSFSGLKTAVLHEASRLGAPSAQDVADLAASFQAAVADVLEDRTRRAMARFRADYPGTDAPALVVAGGVAANRALRERLGVAAVAAGFRLAAPPLHLCTDNGAMVAWAGLERLRLGLADGLDAAPRARWPLDGKVSVPAKFAHTRAAF
jgi:N6-L-threonylcarbamoyladenine synthase